MQHLDVVIVGAGAAGIGMALALQKVSALHFGVIESGRVGESFRRWPAQTRLITPSFHSNPFGLADLNAVNDISSPAIFAGVEHLSGEQYAQYLTFLAQAHDLPIITDCKVLEVTPEPTGGFHLRTDYGELHCRYLIWATGEYQFPKLTPFPGARHCPHYAQVSDWTEFDASDYTVIGGYESGVDASVNLIGQGCRVRLLVRKADWDVAEVYDPSLSLSPYSRERLNQALVSGRLEVIFGVDVVEVSQTEAGAYRIHAADGRDWEAAQAPILGTGFLPGGGAQQIADLWAWDEAGQVVLSEADESTRTPGLFLIGPQVRHDARIYCFIYKFRQRFELLARNLARQLDLDDRDLPGETDTWGPFGNAECCEGCEC